MTKECEYRSSKILLSLMISEISEIPKNIMNAISFQDQNLTSIKTTKMMCNKFKIKECARFKKVTRAHTVPLEECLQVIYSLQKIGIPKNNRLAEKEAHVLLVS